MRQVDGSPDLADFVAELRLVRRAGMRGLSKLLPRLPALREVAAEVYGQDDTMTVDVLLTDAWRQLGNGPHGQIIGTLFGLAPGRRGGAPAALRQEAAKGQGYATVETFRKVPESRALDDFALQVVSIRAQRRARPAASDDKVLVILTQVEELSALELAELARRLAARLGPIPPMRR